MTIIKKKNQNYFDKLPVEIMLMKKVMKVTMMIHVVVVIVANIDMMDEQD